MESTARVTANTYYDGDGGGIANPSSIVALTLRGLLNQACASAQDYLASLDDRHVGATQQASTACRPSGRDPVTGVRLTRFEEACMNMAPGHDRNHGRTIFGGVIGGSLPVTVAAHWFADAGRKSCLSDISPISADLE